MNRQFPIAVAKRRLRLCVLTVDECWELWLCEGSRRLLLAGRVSIDEAIAAWRGGCDAVAAMRKEVIDGVERSKIVVPLQGDLACPARCNRAASDCAR